MISSITINNFPSRKVLKNYEKAKERFDRISSEELNEYLKFTNKKGKRFVDIESRVMKDILIERHLLDLPREKLVEYASRPLSLLGEIADFFMQRFGRYSPSVARRTIAQSILQEYRGKARRTGENTYEIDDKKYKVTLPKSLRKNF